MTSKSKLPPELVFRARMGSIGALGSLCVPRYKQAWFHRDLCLVLEGVIRYTRFKGEFGGHSRALISMPRRHGKSMHGAALLPAAFLGLSPELKVMSTAYNTDQAKASAKGTRAIIESASYPFPVGVGAAFDRVAGRVRRVENQVDSFETLRLGEDGSVEPAGGRFFAVGVEGGATGQGFHLGIMDDWVKDPASARSPAFRLRRQEFRDACFESGQESTHASIIAIGTMWGKPDFLDTVEQNWRAQGHTPHWVRYSALYDPTIVGVSENDPRQPGEGLWIVRHPGTPGFFEGDVDADLAKSQGFYEGFKSSLEEALWHAQWQQSPRGLGGVIFPKDVWRRYTDEDFDLQDMQELHISIDPNVKKTGRSFASIGVYGVAEIPNHGGTHYFMLDRVRGHWDYSDLRTAVGQTLDRWVGLLPRAARHPMSRVWVEDRANGPAILSEPMFRDQSLVRFEQVPKMASKETCYRLAAPVASTGGSSPDPRSPFKPGRVHLPKGEFTGKNAGVRSHWVDPKGGFIDELFNQQPVTDPNDDADQFAQLIICREQNLGPELLALRG